MSKELGKFRHIFSAMIIMTFNKYVLKLNLGDDWHQLMTLFVIWATFNVAEIQSMLKRWEEIDEKYDN